MTGKRLSAILESKNDVLKLRKRADRFLQVLIPSFTLSKEENGQRLDIRITDENFSVVDWNGKNVTAKLLKNRRKDKLQLEKELRKFKGDPKLRAYRFDCEEYMLRWANGGALPIARLREGDGRREYFCLFYRDVFPVGWNIANGASDDLDEILDPSRIILREFGEELFIRDNATDTIYVFDPGKKFRPPSFQVEPLEQWKQILGADLNPHEVAPTPVRWIDGPDRVCGTVHGRSLVGSLNKGIETG